MAKNMLAFVGEAVGGVVALHALLSATAILAPFVGQRASAGGAEFAAREGLTSRSASSAPSSVSGGRKRVMQALSEVYSNQGVATFQEVLEDKVVFEDPLMYVRGKAKVVEAFRAMKAIHPRQVSVEDRQLADGLVLNNVNEYSVGGRTFTLESTVEVKLSQEEKITELRDLWKHKEMHAWTRPSRRVNGIVLDALTRVFVR